MGTKSQYPCHRMQALIHSGPEWQAPYVTEVLQSLPILQDVRLLTTACMLQAWWYLTLGASRCCFTRLNASHNAIGLVHPLPVTTILYSIEKASNGCHTICEGVAGVVITG